MTAATKRQNETTTTTTDEPAILDRVLEQTLAKLDRDAHRYYEAIQDDALGHMHRAVVLAKGIDNLRKSLDPLMPFFLSLQGSDLGFKTDKDTSGGYPKETVRDCLITGFLLGVLPTGNQMNILAGRCYVTKNGWAYKLSQIPGLTGIEVIKGVPRQVDGQTCVRVMVNYRLNGVAQRLSGVDGNGNPIAGRVFPVRVNEKMIVDAILGKAEAKALKAVYESIRGRDFLPSDDESDTSGVVNDPPTGKFDLKTNGKTPPAAQPENGLEMIHPETIEAIKKAANLACSAGAIAPGDVPEKIHEYTGRRQLADSDESAAQALLAHLLELGARP